MQLTPLTSTPTAPTSPPARPDFGGIALGRIDRPGRDLDLYTTRAVLGERRGYASLETAINAAARLTAGSAPAAAVFSGGDHYFLASVAWRNRGNGQTGLYDGVGTFGERGIRFDRPDVLALVDANVLVRPGRLGQYTPIHR
ncbi:MAG: hypothetical protein JWM98_2623 [Thermoleophilia bacterium]|nr:hypothetical protein [Thermoleophilia bacterium]